MNVLSSIKYYYGMKFDLDRVVDWFILLIIGWY